jgi:uncharacterized membrane-anchored protein
MARRSKSSASLSGFLCLLLVGAVGTLGVYLVVLYVAAHAAIQVP